MTKNLVLVEKTELEKLKAIAISNTESNKECIRLEKQLAKVMQMNRALLERLELMLEFLIKKDLSDLYTEFLKEKDGEDNES